MPPTAPRFSGSVCWSPGVHTQSRSPVFLAWSIVVLIAPAVRGVPPVPPRAASRSRAPLLWPIPPAGDARPILRLASDIRIVGERFKQTGQHSNRDASTVWNAARQRGETRASRVRKLRRVGCQNLRPHPRKCRCAGATRILAPHRWAVSPPLRAGRRSSLRQRGWREARLECASRAPPWSIGSRGWAVSPPPRAGRRSSLRQGG
jgi:hypothetical protein